MDHIKNLVVRLLRKSEQYTKTDMVYMVKNTFWINANTIIITFLSFGLSLLFSHFVSKEVYGVYQFIISISSIIGALTLTGINTAVNQAVARGFEGVYPKAIRLQFKWSAIPIVVSVALASYYFFQDNIEIALGIIFAGLTVPFTNALNTWGGYLTGRKLFKPIFFYTQIINILYYGTIIIPIILFPQALPILAVSLGFGLIANFIIYKDITKRYPNNTKSDEETLRYGGKLSLSNILPMALFQVDNIIVFHLLGATELAIYVFASNIPDRFIGLLRAIPSIAFPKFANKDLSEISRILPFKLLQFFILSLIGGTIYYLLAPFIYNVLFPQYIESLRYSQIYILAPLIAVVGSLSTTALFATRSTNVFKANAINPIVSIAMVIIGGYTFGIWGVIFGRILSNAFTLFITTYFVRKVD